MRFASLVHLGVNERFDRRNKIATATMRKKTKEVRMGREIGIIFIFHHIFPHFSIDLDRKISFRGAERKEFCKIWE